MFMAPAWVIILGFLSLPLLAVIAIIKKDENTCYSALILMIIFFCIGAITGDISPEGISSPVAIPDGTFPVYSISTDNNYYYIIAGIYEYAPRSGEWTEITPRFYRFPINCVQLVQNSKWDNTFFVKWDRQYPTLVLYWNQPLQQVKPFSFPSKPK